MDLGAGLGLQQTQRVTGCMLRDNWPTIWPELRVELEKVYAKVQALPFVDGGWLSAVRDLHSKNRLCVMIPARLPGGSPRPDMPAWLQEPAAAAAWDKVEREVNSIIFKFAQQKTREGLDEIRKLNAKAAFWDGLYVATKFVADLPANAIKATLGGIGDVSGGILKAVFGSWVVWAALAGGGLFLAWKAGVFRAGRK